jgi:hypothetical protein
LRRIRLLGILLGSIGLAFLLYAGVETIFIQYSESVSKIGIIGSILGLIGILLFREPKTKQTPF